MIIGIDGSQAFAPLPTGVGWFSRGLIRALASESLLKEHRVLLFLRKGQKVFGFESIPGNWEKVAIANTPFWTQFGLRRALVKRHVDVILVPGHALPIFLPCRGIYVFHGAEMRKVPECYPILERLINDCLIQQSVRKASQVLAVSNSSRDDAVRLYGAAPSKLETIYQGIEEAMIKNDEADARRLSLDEIEKYILFIGKLEARKNIVGIIKAFGILKGKGYSHKLILVGGEGYQYKRISEAIRLSPYRDDIVIRQNVSERDKRNLIKQASCLLLVSFAEGFGRPVLEGLMLGVPVAVSNIPVFKELYGDIPAYANPKDAHSIADAIIACVKADEADILRRNAQFAKIRHKFDWAEIARKTADAIVRQ